MKGDARGQAGLQATQAVGSLAVQAAGMEQVVMHGFDDLAQAGMDMAARPRPGGCGMLLGGASTVAWAQAAQRAMTRSP